MEVSHQLHAPALLEQQLLYYYYYCCCYHHASINENSKNNSINCGIYNFRQTLSPYTQKNGIFLQEYTKDNELKIHDT
jgi:hypothetical protein